MKTVQAAPRHDLDLVELYSAQWHPMVRLAVLLVDDVGSAEDVVQDAFIGLYRNVRKVRDPAAAVAYLRTAVVNGARSMLRKRQTARRYLSTGAVSDRLGDAADRPIIVAAENAKLIEAVQRLPRRQREVLILRYWSHLSEAEIARTLGVSIGTVKSSASRGLDALEATLGGVR